MWPLLIRLILYPTRSKKSTTKPMILSNMKDYVKNTTIICKELIKIMQEFVEFLVVFYSLNLATTTNLFSSNSPMQV